MKEIGTAPPKKGEQCYSPYYDETSDEVYFFISYLPGTLSGAVPVASWNNSPALPHGQYNTPGHHCN